MTVICWHCIQVPSIRVALAEDQLPRVPTVNLYVKTVSKGSSALPTPGPSLRAEGSGRRAWAQRPACTGLGDPRAQSADSQGAWLSPPARCPSHGACTQDLCQAGVCEQLQPQRAMRELDHPTAPEVTGPRDQSHTPSTPVLRGHSWREREPPPHFRNNPSRTL